MFQESQQELSYHLGSELPEHPFCPILLVKGNNKGQMGRSWKVTQKRASIQGRVKKKWAVIKSTTNASLLCLAAKNYIVGDREYKGKCVCLVWLE